MERMLRGEPVASGIGTPDSGARSWARTAAPANASANAAGAAVAINFKRADSFRDISVWKAAIGYDLLYGMFGRSDSGAIKRQRACAHYQH